MPSLVPLAAEPAQEISVTLSGQACRIRVYARATDVPLFDETYVSDTALYLDLYLNDILTIAGVRCRDRTLIVRDSYFGLPGDLAFYDLYGTDDPAYDALGTRFVLLFWTVAELVTTVVATAHVITAVPLLDDDLVPLLDDDGIPLTSL